jgi:transposase
MIVTYCKSIFNKEVENLLQLLWDKNRTVNEIAQEIENYAISIGQNILALNIKITDDNQIYYNLRRANRKLYFLSEEQGTIPEWVDWCIRSAVAYENFQKVIKETCPQNGYSF